MAEHAVNSSNQQALDARIILALETAPEISVPSDFAARVAGQLPPLPTVTITPRRYGRNVAMVCMGLLLALILIFAHRATGTSLLWSSIEWIFCVQFALVAVWLAVRQARPYFVWHS